jgi:hypothetical protein
MKQTRQAGLLAFGSSGFSSPSQTLRVQWRVSRSLADYSGGPATDLHRFPYCPQQRAEAPVECYPLYKSTRRFPAATSAHLANSAHHVQSDVANGKCRKKNAGKICVLAKRGNTQVS